MDKIIDWKKLEERGDKRQIFEKFCFHLVSKMLGHRGVLSYFYNTPGSEFYLETQESFKYNGMQYEQGDVIGWQAKFWMGNKDEENSPLGADHKKELIEGFAKTKEYKPSIKRWIVCTPGSFVQKEWDRLTAELGKIDTNCVFDSWHKDIFEGFYLNDHESLNSIYQYYFGERLIQKSVLQEVSKDTLSILKRKYDVDVHSASDFEESLLDVIDDNDAGEKVRHEIKSLKKHSDDDRKKPIIKEHHWAYEYLSDTFKATYITDCEERYKTIDILYSISCEDENVRKNTNVIRKILEEYVATRDVRVKILNEEIKKIRARKDVHVDNLDFFLYELSERVWRLESKLTRDFKHSKKNLSVLIDLLCKKVIPVFAEAGYGKTHFACSLADRLLQKDSPVLLLTGSTFRNCSSCEIKIKEKIGMPNGMPFDDLLDSLDFLAERCRCKLPIIIDGLNETAPNEGRWLEELPPLCRKIEKRSNLILITTCRDKSDYIQVIYGKDKFQEVDNCILLDGIKKENLYITVKKYFSKYNIRPIKLQNISIFENPLLLKIFSITNQGKENLIVNEYSLASCIESYSEQLVNNISQKDGHTNKFLKHKLEQQLNAVAFKIWNKKDRILSFFDEFAPAFDKDDIINNIIDEGLCFTMDKNGSEDLVQFTYDMVAGYHVARSILSKCASSTDFNQFINDNSDKLFGEGKHTLAEDILKSLFYLVPKKFDKQWFEICTSYDVRKASFENIDILLSSNASRNALQKFLSTANLEAEEKDCFTTLLRKRIFSNNIEYFSIFISFFCRLMQKELDLYWNSKFATYPELQNAYSTMHDKYFFDSFALKDRFFFVTMMCGITDTEFRQKYYHILNDLVLKSSSECIDFCGELLQIDDPFIKEIIISVVTGAGLRTDKSILKKSVKLLESLILNSNTTNVVLLDDLETLYSYGEAHYAEKFDRTLLYKNCNVQWPVMKELSLSMYSIYGYDFEKYNVRPLYEKGYNRNPLYSEKQIYGMLESKIISYGYDEKMYNELQNKEYNKANYRHEYKCHYSFKYGRNAIMELYGWLLLNGKLTNEFVGTFRTYVISIDPSCPRIMQRRNLFSKSLLPKTLDDLESWLQDSSIEEMKNMTICTLPRKKGDWVLLQGYFSQKTDEKYSDIHMSCISQFVPPKTRFNELAKDHSYGEIDYNHAFASELTWRDLEFTDDYEEYHSSTKLMSRYSFTSWSQDRFKYSRWIYLKTALAKELGIVFDMNRMSYILDGEEVSAYYDNDTDFFFYLRKDVVDRILEMHNVKLRFHYYEYRAIDAKLPESVPLIKDRFKQVDEDAFYDGEKLLDNC